MLQTMRAGIFGTGSAAGSGADAQGRPLWPPRNARQIAALGGRGAQVRFLLC